MITIAICDDESFMIKELEEALCNFFHSIHTEIHVLKFLDGLSLLQCNIPLDIVFLDIQMDGLNGMDTAKKLRNHGYTGFLIFITVLDEMVFQSFEVQAFDYLVKPLKKDAFEKTMHRLFSSLKNNSNHNLFIQKGTECMIIPFADIVYCEVINRKIFLHLSDKKMIDYYDKLEHLEKKLDQRFFKCHRSYLINLKYLRSYRHGLAYLSTGETVPVSRLRNEDFSNAVLHYIKEWGYES